MMESAILADIWQEMLQRMAQEFSSRVFETWLKSAMPLSISENRFEIGVPKKFVKEWIEENYAVRMQQMLEEISGKPLQLLITNLDIKDEEEPITVPAPTAKSENQPTAGAAEQAAATPVEAAVVEEAEAVAAPDEPSALLNPKYTFESFVIGNSNRFAHAAALAVAEVPAKVYNPLFLYGGVGLGKTHLMHAIGNRIQQNHPYLKVLYISSEKFTNELINSILHGNPEAFRQKYRNIDCLLVDDIQFLSKKEHTQEEFFHTFNTLHDANKQIIISSDRPPKEIPTLEDRLRSRFEWGLITDIQPPDLETRIAILRKKAMVENITIPNEIMVYIASRIDNNIRELEGALIRVTAFASLRKEPLTLDMATEALKGLLADDAGRPVTIDKIKEIVASYFRIKLDELIAKKRTRNVAYPRQIAMYLARDLTDSSLPRIGEVFGGRDHTTVIHACEKITKERNEDAKLDQTIKELTKRIQQG